MRPTPGGNGRAITTMAIWKKFISETALWGKPERTPESQERRVVKMEGQWAIEDAVFVKHPHELPGWDIRAIGVVYDPERVVKTYHPLCGDGQPARDLCEVARYEVSEAKGAVKLLRRYFSGEVAERGVAEASGLPLPGESLVIPVRPITSGHSWGEVTLKNDNGSFFLDETPLGNWSEEMAKFS